LLRALARFFILSSFIRISRRSIRICIILQHPRRTKQLSRLYTATVGASQQTTFFRGFDFQMIRKVGSTVSAKATSSQIFALLVILARRPPRRAPSGT
jgi:hypothetical protein